MVAVEVGLDDGAGRDLRAGAAHTRPDAGVVQAALAYDPSPSDTDRTQGPAFLADRGGRAADGVPADLLFPSAYHAHHDDQRAHFHDHGSLGIDRTAGGDLAAERGASPFFADPVHVKLHTWAAYIRSGTNLVKWSCSRPLGVRFRIGW